MVFLVSCSYINWHWSCRWNYIPQYENEELITEGLSILTQWVPDWKPWFFMVDKSSVELGPVAAVHPQCFRLLCDFHHAQAVERWVNKGTNGVHPTDKARDYPCNCVETPLLLELY